MEVLQRFFSKLKNKLPSSLPVIVYQMGKCGSTSIFQSLKSYCYLDVYQIHRMNREYIKSVWRQSKERDKDPPYEMDKKGIEIWESIIQEGRNVKIICPIREPVSRNVSAFFYNFHDELTGGSNIDNLLEEFLKKYPHDVPLKWFQRETCKTLNINVFDYKFPKERGYKVYSQKNIDFLVLKSELKDAKKEKIIENFLDINKFVINRSNQAKSLEYGKVYSRFKENINLPKEYVESLCNAKYTKHFYSENEIQKIKKIWTLTK